MNANQLFEAQQLPAFPTIEDNAVNNGAPGMTLRDYFAAAALASPSMVDARDAEDMSNRAYDIADEMLAAREL